MNIALHEFTHTFDNRVIKGHDKVFEKTHRLI